MSSGASAPRIYTSGRKTRTIHGGLVGHSHQHGSCDNAPAKVDVALDSLLNSAPREDSLPARILAKSREVAAQSGHKAVYTVGMDVGSTTVKAVVVDTATDEMIW